jgi:hypothetical protein
VRLVSRKGTTYKPFPALCQSLGACLNTDDAVLDGKIVYLGPERLRRGSPGRTVAVAVRGLRRLARGVDLFEAVCPRGEIQV